MDYLIYSLDNNETPVFKNKGFILKLYNDRVYTLYNSETSIIELEGSFTSEFFHSLSFMMKQAKIKTYGWN